MSHLITLAIAIPSAIVCLTLIELGVRLFGPRTLREHYRQRRIEEVRALRSLHRWQVVLIEGVLKFGLYMALVFTVVDFVRSRYEAGHIFDTEDVLVNIVIFGLIGIWTGYSSWNRIWDHKYDPPAFK